MRIHILCFVLLCSTTLFILLLKLALAVKSSLRLAPSSLQHAHILCFFSEHFLIFWPHKMLQNYNYAAQGVRLTGDRRPETGTSGGKRCIYLLLTASQGCTALSLPCVHQPIYTLTYQLLCGSVFSPSQVHTWVSNI